MTKRIICTKPDGGIAVIIPAPKALEKMTIKEIAEKDSHGLPYRIVDVSDLPQDRYFRDAWLDKGNEIDVDIAKARGIHMEEIRKHRNRKLEALDLETLKGVDVQEQKQVLRDLPQNFDLSNVQTLDEIKNLWPTELAG